MSHVHDARGDDLPPEVLRQAAVWFASLADESASAADRQSWRQWLDSHPDHARAWHRVEAIMGRLVPLTETGRAAGAALTTARRKRRRILGALGALLVAGGGASLLQLPWHRWRDEAAMRRAAYHAGMGDVSTTTLQDGTRIWLGSLGILDLGYDRALRRLHLYRGDLLVETATDHAVPARPFVVDTPHGRLRALGTRFAVRADPGTTRVDVFEGAVELTPADAGDPVHTVHAGGHAVFDRAMLRAVGQASPGRESWTRGMLAADRMRLDELAAELARWHPTPIECDEEVAGLQVVGAYPLLDLDRALAALAEGLPIRVVRDGTGIRLAAGEARPGAPAIYDMPPRRIR